MNAVPDAFLLEVAGITSSLLGFFVVGVFFYVQRGMFPLAAGEAQGYLRAATRTVIVLYGLTLTTSLGLVVFDPRAVSWSYAALALLLLWSTARTSRAIGLLHRALDVRVLPRVYMWVAALAVVAAPWGLGGAAPSRSHLTAALLLMGGFAFVSSASLVLSAFDISRLEAVVEIPGDDGATPRGSRGEGGRRPGGWRPQERSRNERSRNEGRSAEERLRRWEADAVPRPSRDHPRIGPDSPGPEEGEGR